MVAVEEVKRKLKVHDEVTLLEEDDSIVPAGTYIVSKINENGSFHVGGRTAVWPERIAGIR